MAATIDLTQHHALNHYVLTGQTQQLDGGAYHVEYESPSDESPPPNVVERWRKHKDPAVILLDGQAPSLPTEAGTTPKIAVRRRSSGQQTPSPTTSLPVNSRTEVSVPRDIAAWRQGVPVGCQPPDDAPWASRLSDKSSVSGGGDPESQVISHTDRKLDTDIATALSSSAPTSLPTSSANMDVHQWRYENFVDWWRTGMAAQQGLLSPPPQIMEIDGCRTSTSDLGVVTPGKHGECEARVSPLITVPAPPPPPQVIRVVEIPSLQVTSSQTKVNHHENLKRVYYRLISRDDRPIPVRELSRTTDMVGDKSIGVLFLENPSSYRTKDLMTVILSRECSHTPTPSSNFSPRLRKKFAEQNPPGGASLRSPTGSAFAAEQLPPAGQVKLKLYSNASRGKGRKLKENDLLPKGCGVDERTALVVQVFSDETSLKRGNSKTKTGSKGPVGMSRRGVAAAIRGLASGLRSVGDGLGKFADCLSGSGIVRSKAGSQRGH